MTQAALIFRFIQKKKTLQLETGYKLYYPSIKEFLNIIKRSNKYFFYRNKNKVGDKLYIEVLFGDKGLDKDINSQLIYFSRNNQNKSFRKYLSLNKIFMNLMKHLSNNPYYNNLSN